MFRHGVMQAYLIVASADADAIDAALASGADALVVDGEGPALAALSRAVKRPSLLVRIGPIESQDEQRLSTIVTARPEAILLDAAHGRDLAHLGARLAVHEAEQGLPDGTIGIIALLARPEAFLHAASFVAASPRLRAIGWDAELLAKAMSAGISLANGQLHGPLAQTRVLVRLTAAAAGVEAIETAYPFADADALQLAIAAARRDGFMGMLTRNPAQVFAIRTAPPRWITNYSVSARDP